MTICISEGSTRDTEISTIGLIVCVFVCVHVHVDLYAYPHTYVLVNGSAFHTGEHIMYVNTYLMKAYVLFI